MIGYLTGLSKVFDALNDNILRMEETKNMIARDMSSFKNLELSDPKALEQLGKEFSPQKLMMLMKIFFQVAKFTEKYSPGLEEKIKEYNDTSKLIKEINNDLKEILRDEKSNMLRWEICLQH